MSEKKAQQKKLSATRTRRTYRVRNALKSLDSSRPRVTVFRSSKHISAQIIDDANSTTLASFSSLSLTGEKANKTDLAHMVGKELSKKAKELSINKVVFDRGRCLFHGRVKALAQGLRDGGLEL